MKLPQTMDADWADLWRHGLESHEQDRLAGRTREEAAPHTMRAYNDAVEGYRDALVFVLPRRGQGAVDQPQAVLDFIGSALGAWMDRLDDAMGACNPSRNLFVELAREAVGEFRTAITPPPATLQDRLHALKLATWARRDLKIAGGKLVLRHHMDRAKTARAAARAACHGKHPKTASAVGPIYPAPKQFMAKGATRLTAAPIELVAPWPWPLQPSKEIDVAMASPDDIATTATFVARILSLRLMAVAIARDMVAEMIRVGSVAEDVAPIRAMACSARYGAADLPYAMLPLALAAHKCGLEWRGLIRAGADQAVVCIPSPHSDLLRPDAAASVAADIIAMFEVLIQSEVDGETGAQFVARVAGMRGQPVPSLQA